MSRPGMDSQTASSLSWFRNWVSSQLGGIRHERRVAAIARSLFDVTLPLHDLTRSDLRLLKLAAYLHDVGRSINNKNHPAIGTRMIRRDRSLPLKKRQRRELAFLTLRHRGRVPEAEQDPALRRISNPPKLRLLLALLRAADALDNRGLASPRLNISRRGRQIRIVCRLSEDTAKARRIFSRRKKFKLLEELLDCNVDVEIVSRRRLSAVA
jgi:exopolyphosphatase / guanosine-5'-triphosphate,3'-diphosphate pyrophosphatase